jgi:hypothetical protein
MALGASGRTDTLFMLQMGQADVEIHPVDALDVQFLNTSFTECARSLVVTQTSLQVCLVITACLSHLRSLQQRKVTDAPHCKRGLSIIECQSASLHLPES